MSKQLKLSSNKMILGVCAGLAEFFGIDTKIMRLATIILALCGGIGVMGYLIIALVMYILSK